MHIDQPRFAILRFGRFHITRLLFLRTRSSRLYAIRSFLKNARGKKKLQSLTKNEKILCW
jgi:hypothetical protein